MSLYIVNCLSTAILMLFSFISGENCSIFGQGPTGGMVISGRSSFHGKWWVRQVRRRCIRSEPILFQEKNVIKEYVSSTEDNSVHI